MIYKNYIDSIACKFDGLFWVYVPPPTHAVSADIATKAMKAKTPLDVKVAVCVCTHKIRKKKMPPSWLRRDETACVMCVLSD